MKRGSRKKRIQESREVTVEREQNLDSKQKVSSIEVKEKKKKTKKIIAENQESDSGEEVLKEEEEGVKISEQEDRDTLKPSRGSIETRITNCKLEITARLLVLKDLLEEESTDEEQFKAQKVVEKLEKKLEVLMKLKNLASGERSESSEEPKVKARKQSRVPSNLPMFRGSKGIEDPLEFIEQFERICQANEGDEDCYIVLVVLCLDSTYVQWVNKYLKEDEDRQWNIFWKVFVSHFQHPDAAVVFQNKITTLRVDSTGVQRYSDQFMRLAMRLGWDLRGDLAIFQYKNGLPG